MKYSFSISGRRKNFFLAFSFHFLLKPKRLLVLLKIWEGQNFSKSLPFRQHKQNLRGEGVTKIFEASLKKSLHYFYKHAYGAVGTLL